MKADIILNSYLSSKSTILYKFFWKNWISKFFASILEGKKISTANFSKILFLGMISNTENGNYMKLWHSWHHSGGSGKQSKLLLVDSTPLGLIRVNSSSADKGPSFLALLAFRSHERATSAFNLSVSFQQIEVLPFLLFQFLFS